MRSTLATAVAILVFGLWAVVIVRAAIRARWGRRYRGRRGRL